MQTPNLDLFGLNEGQLMKILKEEAKRTQEMAAQATKEMHKIVKDQTRTLSIKAPKIQTFKEGFNRNAQLIQAISEERRKQSQIRMTLEKIKSGNFNLKQISQFDFVQETSNIGARTGEGAKDKYARVMENISHPADIRATWDSSDVLKLDDIAIEQGISYDEAERIFNETNYDTELEGDI